MHVRLVVGVLVHFVWASLWLRAAHGRLVGGWPMAGCKVYGELVDHGWVVDRSAMAGESLTSGLTVAGWLLARHARLLPGLLPKITMHARSAHISSYLPVPADRGGQDPVPGSHDKLHPIQSNPSACVCARRRRRPPRRRVSSWLG